MGLNLEIVSGQHRSMLFYKLQKKLFLSSTKKYAVWSLGRMK